MLAAVAAEIKGDIGEGGADRSDCPPRTDELLLPVATGGPSVGPAMDIEGGLWICFDLASGEEEDEDPADEGGEEGSVSSSSGTVSVILL